VLVRPRIQLQGREIAAAGTSITAAGAAGFALLFATSATFAQQQSPTVRVRGTVEGVDGPMLTVKSRDGQTTYKVKMADNVATATANGACTRDSHDAVATYARHW
jgi:hypothetical protein